MNKAVFLDRDGTIIHDYGYNYRPGDQLTILPGVIPVLKALQEKGYLLVVITNQSGIARGKYSETDYRVFEKALNVQLLDGGVTLAGSYHCPHGPDDTCDCRKPAPGMVQQAAQELDIDTTQSYFIGDKDEDMLVGKAVGCKTIRIKDDKYPSTVEADVMVASLAEVLQAVTF